MKIPTFGRSGRLSASHLDAVIRQDSTADGREEMTSNVVRFVNIRLHQRDMRDARIAADDVEHGHAAGACADLEKMGHAKSFHTASGSGQSPVSCQTS